MVAGSVEVEFRVRWNPTRTGDAGTEDEPREGTMSPDSSTSPPVGTGSVGWKLMLRRLGVSKAKMRDLRRLGVGGLATSGATGGAPCCGA